MSSVHRDPVVLRTVAAEIEALLLALRVPGLDPVDLAALARAPRGTALLAEHDLLTAAVARTGEELAELAAGLGAVVAATEFVEHEAVCVMRTLGR